ncbi:MAG: deoxyribodipyrimidine photo-lyase, partial [Planctomycetota bacterium]
MRALVWFRRDLRVDDNAALASAAEFATDGIVAVYFVTPQQWIEHDEAPCKIKFWLDHLESLSAKLAELNIPLLIEQCDSFLDVPKRILKLAQNHDCSDLFFNHEYEANEQQRDQHVIDQFELNDLNTHCFHDRVVVPPETIKTKEGKFYSVFTPYRKVWDRVA